MNIILISLEHENWKCSIRNSFEQDISFFDFIHFSFILSTNRKKDKYNLNKIYQTK